MASVGSPSTLLILEDAKKVLNGRRLTTVVDFRDFWALNQRYDVPRDRQGGKKNSRRGSIEHRVLKTVDGVVVVSHAYKRRLMTSYPWLADDKVLVLENGFVEADFTAAEKRISPKRRIDCFIIRYTGFLLEDHNPQLFFEALRWLKYNKPLLYAKIRFEYFGGNPSFVMAQAELSDVRDICSFCDYTPHSKVVELLLTSDALYLPFARGDGTIGAKTYEYLRSGRPLIPVLSDCEEPQQLLSRFGVLDCISRGTPEAVASLITRLVENREMGKRQVNVPTVQLGSIERFQQTRVLDAWLRSLAQ